MRDFFARQEAAHQSTWLLFFYFALAMLVIGVLLTVIIYVLVFTWDVQRLYTHATPFLFDPAEWDHRTMARIGSVVLLLIASGSLYKYLRLRSGGGSLIAEMLGGRVVYPDAHDLHERRLLHIVEEMAIASGVTVPTVYLLEREWGINAFAAGFTEEDAVLGVTKGALYYLTRDELQGVIAHEFSHVLNGDMLINIRLQGLLHGILVIGLLGEMLVKTFFVSGSRRTRARSDGEGGSGGDGSPGMIVVGIVLYVIGYTGVFIARIIKSAVCRQREFLADAAAVQFTRNPLGLAGALKKIGGLTAGSRIRAPRASEISHMYFENGLSASRLGLLSTHPPLSERIRRLDPAFRGSFPEHIQPVEIDQEEAMMYASAVAQPVGSQVLVGEAGGTGDSEWHVFIHSLIAGRNLKEALLDPELEYGRVDREIRGNFPLSILEAVGDGAGAQAVLYALLLASEESERRQQLARLKQGVGPQVWQEFVRLQADVDALILECRLFLIDLALPALNTLSLVEHESFTVTARALLDHDAEPDLFAYACSRVLARRFDPRFTGPSGEAPVQVDSFAHLSTEVSCVLTFVARSAAVDQGEARRLLMHAIRLFGKEMKHFGYLAPERSSLQAFDRALKVLAGCTPEIRRQVLAACLECIVADGVVTENEALLYRIVTEAFDGPVPRWLTASGPEEDGG